MITTGLPIPYGQTFYIKPIGYNGTGKLYIKRSTDLDLVEIASNLYDEREVNITSFDLGARTIDNNSSCTFSGSIDLSKSYIIINGFSFFSPIVEKGIVKYHKN